MKRRTFVRNTSLTAAVIGFNPFYSYGLSAENKVKLALIGVG